MCPSLPKAIRSEEPKYSDFIYVESRNPEWLEQYRKYNQAKEMFESKYKVEIAELESKWQAL
jgi:hypothetical protein